MGLKDKIKDALHKDRDQPESSNVETPQAPGAFPSDTTDTKLGQSKDAQYQKDDLSTGQGYTGTGYGHRATDSGVDFGDRTGSGKRSSDTQEPYWGSMGQGKNETGAYTGSATDSSYGYGSSGLAGTTSSNNGPHDSNLANKADPRVDSDRDHRAAPSSTSGRLHKDLPARPHEHSSLRDTAATQRADRYDDRYEDRFDDRYDDNIAPTGPSSGGTYNTVAGAGSREYQTGGKHHDTLGDDRYERSTHDNRGLGAAGAAGLGAAGAGAGYAAARRSHDDDYQNRSPPYKSSEGQYGTADQPPTYQGGRGGGVTSSSMLDPSTTTTTRSGPHDSNLANRVDPRVDSDRDGSQTLPGSQDNQTRGFGSSNVAGAGAGAGTGAGVAALTGMGPNHYGPAHEGAKVMHRCVGCGLDNDISQYFRKDAVYRMG